MSDMPRKYPRYVYPERSRHGNVRMVFRKGKGKRLTMPNIDDPLFDEAYRHALDGISTTGRSKLGASSLSWLIRQYRGSSDYLGYAKGTRKVRDAIYRQVEKTAGYKSYRSVTKAHILAGKEKRKETPNQARMFLDAMRGLFKWAVESELLETNPVDGVLNPRRAESSGFEIWTDEEVKRYRDHWQIGTHERVWFEIVIGAGARRGDAVVLGKQHVREGCFAIRTAKEGVWAYPPILPETIEAIKRGPVGDLTFIIGKSGRAFTKESFGNKFRVACNQAGISKSAHGLRKYAATRFAEMGLSEAELEVIFGWVCGSGVAAYYSQEAARKRLAKEAMGKIENKNYPNPKSKFPNYKNNTDKLDS